MFWKHGDLGYCETSCHCYSIPFRVECSKRFFETASLSLLHLVVECMLMFFTCACACWALNYLILLDLIQCNNQALIYTKVLFGTAYISAL